MVAISTHVKRVERKGGDGRVERDGEPSTEEIRVDAKSATPERTSSKFHSSMRRHVVVVKASVPVRIRHQD